MENRFRDRIDAGVQLANALHRYVHCPGLVVLALPRGGVPVAFEVARALGAVMDVLVVRKLSSPKDTELPIGAIAPRGVLFLNQHVLRGMRVPEAQLEATIKHERKEMGRLETLYRGGREAIDLERKVVIVVDDGLATGASMHAALESVRAAYPARLIVAVPIAPAGALAGFAGEADEFVCLMQPEQLLTIGGRYIDFTQTSETMVCELMDRAYQLGGAVQAIGSAFTPASRDPAA